MGNELHIIAGIKKPLQKLSKNKLENIDLHLEENDEYLEIADEIMKYSFENDNLESGEKNINISK